MVDIQMPMPGKGSSKKLEDKPSNTGFEDKSSKKYQIQADEDIQAVRRYTLRMNLSGPPGCALTKLQQQRVLLHDPWPGCVLVFDGEARTIKHTEQNLDTNTKILYLGAVWTEPEFYDRELAGLIQQGWQVYE